MHLIPTLTTFRLSTPDAWGTFVFQFDPRLPKKNMNVQLGNITDQHLTEEIFYYSIVVLEFFFLNKKFYLFQLPKETSSQSCTI